MASVAIVHLQGVDVAFVLRSSGQTSQIQLLLEQSQNQGLNCFELRASDIAPLTCFKWKQRRK
jgi:hypothetical protein